MKERPNERVKTIERFLVASLLSWALFRNILSYGNTEPTLWMWVQLVALLVFAAIAVYGFTLMTMFFVNDYQIILVKGITNILVKYKNVVGYVVTAVLIAVGLIYLATVSTFSWNTLVGTVVLELIVLLGVKHKAIVNLFNSIGDDLGKPKVSRKSPTVKKRQ